MRQWLRKLFVQPETAFRRMAIRRPRRTILQAEGLEPRVVQAVSTFATFNGFNGAYARSGLTADISGNFVGTTSDGGAYGYGTVFEVEKDSGAITTLASFNGANGANGGGTLNGDLIEDSSGNIFGTTVYGGPGYTDPYSGYGTVFEVQRGTGTIITLASFNGSNGANPYGSLAEDNNGNCFGTTGSGGANNYGVVFEVPKGSGAVTVLASFNGTNGVSPLGGLVEDGSGNLFGTTSGGGPSGKGTVFEMLKGSGTITTLATFNGSNGQFPYGTLVLDSSGNLFGTTSQLANASGGSVFEVVNGSSTITTLATFDGTDRAHPYGSLLLDASGNLFGTTNDGGASGAGTVFEVAKNSGAITTLGSFNNLLTIGQNPQGGLVLDSGGNLFGSTVNGGVFRYGTVFEVQGATEPVATITTPTLENGTVNQAGYNQTISVAGGIGPYTFATSSGSLPSGLTLSASGVLSGTPTAEGTFNFTVTATDSTGTTATQSYLITISPAPFSQYLVTAQGSSTVEAGNSFLVTVQATDQYGNPVSSYSGPATVTVTISPSSSASSFPTTVTINSSGLGYFLATLQKVGTYTITVSGGSIAGNAAPVTVTPASPAGLTFAAQPTSTPTGDTLPKVSVAIVDGFGNVVTSDNSDPITVSVASGPGSFTPGSTTTAIVTNGVSSFSNLTLATPGKYKLSAMLAEHFIISSATFTVLPLQVVPGSFAGTPSGFSLQFNAPFLVNSVTPVLYGQGFGATAPVPTVTLTESQDATGHPVNSPVEGSLVLNTLTNSITFVATNTALEANNGSPILPDGTYTAVVHGSAAGNGFQALDFGGGFLDGLGSGTPGSGDFTSTFLVNGGAASDNVVWAPDVADGPGQTLNAPGMNRAGGGYPIYLADSSGTVTNVQVTLNYNPALLTVSGANGAGFTLLAGSTTGQALLQYSGPALPAGSQTPIGFIIAAVPSGTASNPTPYKAKDLLHLSGVTINGSPSNVVTSDGLHLVAYVGDADGNGSYSSNDAVLITRAAIQSDSGFAAYPLVDPVIVADTDGSGFIPADAALQANEAGVGFPAPNLASAPVPVGVHFRAIANNVDPSLSIPSGLQVSVDGTVTVPVNIDDADPVGSTGLLRANLALTYDPHVFMVSAADVHLGSVLAAGNGWSVQPTINLATGQIAIALSSTTPISSSLEGSLVTIDFHQVGTGGSAATPIALVASVNPTGQQVVTTELEDAQGTFTLTPALSNALDPRINSVVTLVAAPTTALIDTPAVEIAEFKGAAPAEAHGTPNRAGPEAATLAPTVPEVESQGTNDATAAEPVQADAAHSTIVTAVNVQAFQLGSAQNQLSAIAAGQNLADRLFQAFVPGSLRIGTSHIFIEDTIERTLAYEPQTHASADVLDGLSWDEMGKEPDWQEGDTVLVQRGWQRNTYVTPAVRTVLDTAADRTAFDWCFAHAADDPAQATDGWIDGQEGKVAGTSEGAAGERAQP
jgi:uncharacterized repeat protein (TIGR03803 family)